MPMTTMSMMTTSVRRKFCMMFSTIWPSPAVAAIISAATSVVQPKPMPMRIPVRMSASAAGTTTCRITCHFDAPIEYAALICSIATLLTPERAAIAME